MMRIMSFAQKPLLTSIFLLVSCFGIPAAFADKSAKLVSTQTPTDRLFDIEMLGNVGYAVGEAGLIMKTTDGGETWEKEQSNTTLALTNISLTSKGAVAVGQLGEVVVNANWQGWKRLSTNTDLRLLGVDMNSDGLAIAVGAFGTLMRSQDGGNSWQLLTPDWAPLYDSGKGDTAVIRDEPTNYVVRVFDDGRILIGGEYGTLLTSEDGGESFSVTYRHPEVGDVIAPTLFDLKFYEDVAFAVGQSGLVLVSKDEGRTWSPHNSPTKSSLFAVTGDQSGNIFAIGQRISVVSDDYGQNWKVFDALDISLNWYAGLENKGDLATENLLAVGHSARILSLNPFK